MQETSSLSSKYHQIENSLILYMHIGWIENVLHKKLNEIFPLRFCFNLNQTGKLIFWAMHCVFMIL